LDLIPEDDDAFLQVVELAGKRIEEMKRQCKSTQLRGSETPRKHHRKKESY
jgi:hypothetical protein